MSEHILIKLGKEYFENNRKNQKMHEFVSGNVEANELLNDLEYFPHAFVLASLMDRQIPAERAWILPLRIKKIVGNFEIKHLDEISLEEYTKIFDKFTLHRYNETMAKVFYLGVHRIIEQYNGNASNIWNGNPSSQVVVNRFRKFYGCGQKISTMATNILARDLFVPFSDYKAIDVSADVHVVRVMKRMGLIEKEERSPAIEKAKKMNPEYPGVFDHSCWEIGRKYCHASNPDCSNCIVKGECEKKI